MTVEQAIDKLERVSDYLAERQPYDGAAHWLIDAHAAALDLESRGARRTAASIRREAVAVARGAVSGTLKTYTEVQS